MQCEEAGVFRAFIDGELDQATAGQLEQHLRTCPECQLLMEQVRANADFAALHLGALMPASDNAAAWARQDSLVPSTSPNGKGTTRLSEHDPVPDRACSVRRRSSGEEKKKRMWPMLTHTFSFRQRAALAAALALVLLAGVTILPAGQAAALGFLNLFRAQRFVAVTVDPEHPFDALATLDRLGTVTLPKTQGLANGPTVSTIDEASSKVGFQVRRPTTLPAGVAANPTIRWIPASEASITIDRQKAEAYLRSAGAANASVPPQLDGARITMKMPAAAVLTYHDNGGEPHVIVGEVPSPTATVEGNASLDEIRNFLLSVPGLPASTVAQLRAIGDWTTTLPIPVPQDRAVWHDVSVGGAQGLIVADQTALVGGLIWQRGGIVYGIAGPLSEQQLLDIAQSFK